MSSIIKKLFGINTENDHYVLEIDYVKVRRVSGIVTGYVIGWQTYKNELYYKVRSESLNVDIWVRSTDVLEAWQGLIPVAVQAVA